MKLILRRPVTLARLTLAAGNAVYLVRRITATCFSVSHVADPAARKPADCFQVAASEVETA